VPTVSGYRLFVDSLVSIRQPEEADVLRLRGELTIEGSAQRILEAASRLLSEVTRMAGIVLVPRQTGLRIQEMHFLALGATRVLAILVTQQGEVLNRVLETRRAYSKAELERAGNFINAHYRGIGLETMRERLVVELARAHNEIDGLMTETLEMARAALPAPTDEDVLVSGQANLLDFDELSSMDRLRGLFDAFVEKQTLLHLLDRCGEAEGVQIYIGEESGFGPLRGYSMVAARYPMDEGIAGVLGVIGPTRMAYDRVIPIVDLTARLIGATLKSRSLSP
jgi:heat-inducible transcriptional repressor